MDILFCFLRNNNNTTSCVERHDGSNGVNLKHLQEHSYSPECCINAKNAKNSAKKGEQ